MTDGRTDGRMHSQYLLKRGGKISSNCLSSAKKGYHTVKLISERNIVVLLTNETSHGERLNLITNCLHFSLLRN